MDELGESNEKAKPLSRCLKCYKNFDDIEQLTSHTSEQFCAYITDLDENCLDNIFRFLSPNDLVSISLTCSRFKPLAERCFLLNQDPNIQPIEIGNSTKNIEFYFREEDQHAYERIFKSLFRSVLVTFNENAPRKNIFAFIHINCAPSLRKLTFQVNRDMYCRPLKGEIEWKTSTIAAKLKTLTDLELIDIPGHDLHQSLLQYCENLRTLTICCPGDPDDQSCRYGEDWLKNGCGKIETLKLIGNHDDLDLSSFLRINTNLKKIYCDGHNVRAIHSICQSGNRLENVTILFDDVRLPSQTENVDWNKIVTWCRNGKCGNLELAFGTRCLHDEANMQNNCEYRLAIEKTIILENITTIHLHEHIRHYFENTSNVVAPNVKRLCVSLEYREASENVYDALTRTFPNLLELEQYIDNGFGEDCFLPSVKFISLRRLTCYGEPYYIQEYPDVDFVKLEEKRKENLGATRVEIFTNRKLLEKSSPITVDKPVISLNPIDSFECRYRV